MDRLITMPPQGNVVAKSPTTELRLYSGVPWDNSYAHVRLYQSQSDLLKHLDNWRVTPSGGQGSLSQLSPIRVGDLDVKVPYNEMVMLDVNYLAFCNHGYSNEWVFCFVTSIEWRSAHTTTVHFELDIFQNNFYKCSFSQCFVERSHVPKSQDTIGANLIPESFETGENYVADWTIKAYPPSNICMYVSKETQNDNVEGALVNNVYRAAKLIHNKNPRNINTKIDEMTGAGLSDAILNLFMSPDLCIDAEENPGKNEENVIIDFSSVEWFEGYKPKNNKLYTYPYIYLTVDNNEGQATTYRFEYSDNDSHDLQFSIIGCLCTSPAILLLPWKYNGAELNYMEILTMANFPQCAFQSDTYRAWFAQNQNSIIAAQNAVYDSYQVSEQGIYTSMLGNLGSAVTQVMAGNRLAAGPGVAALVSGQQQLNALDVSAVNQLRSQMAQRKDKRILPPTIHSKVMNTNINAAYNMNKFDFYCMSIRSQYARMIDDYWSAYGYPIYRIQMPNVRSRQSWNYIKTSNCTLHGNVDLAQLAALRSIFNSGVTLWHTDDVGNYALSNN